jgi:hypothetical protein
VIGALIAFSGVYLTARATDRRERENRLWEKRAELYVDALLFLYELRSGGPPPENRKKPDPCNYWTRYTDFSTRLTVYGDGKLADDFEAAAKPTYWTPQDPAHPESAWSYQRLLPFENSVHERITGEPLEPGPTAMTATAPHRRHRKAARLLSGIMRNRRHEDSSDYSTSRFGTVSAAGYYPTPGNAKRPDQ